MSIVKLTVAQKNLLLAMYLRHPRRLHAPKDFGYQVNVMVRLARAGLVEHGKTHFGTANHWSGRLTSAGRKLAKELS